MSRQDGSDWHGARVPKAYKDHYDDNFRKGKEPEYKATIEGTNERYRLIPRNAPGKCIKCGCYMVHKETDLRVCWKCGYKE